MNMNETQGREARWSLPLEHQSLDLQTDVARVTVIPVGPGQKPWLEVQGGHGDGPGVEVDTGPLVTRVRISGFGHGHTKDEQSWWNGPWWDTTFWDKRFWKKAWHAHVILHVPAADVRESSNRTRRRCTSRGLLGV